MVRFWIAVSVIGDLLIGSAVLLCQLGLTLSRYGTRRSRIPAHTWSGETASTGSVPVQGEAGVDPATGAQPLESPLLTSPAWTSLDLALLQTRAREWYQQH